MYQFIKYGKNYLVKNSNGRVVSEEEKLKMENKELILKDITGCGCQKETTKKLSANKKRLKEIEQEKLHDDSVDATRYVIENASIKFSKEKAKHPKAVVKLVKEDADDTIQETTETI